MRRTLLTLALTLSCACSCAFVLDFDELQAGDDAGASGGAAGSSGSAGSAGTDGGPSLSIDELPAALASAICMNLEACFASGIELLLLENDCQTFFEASLEDGLLAAVKNRMDAGVVDYDGARAAQCVSQLEKASQGAPQCADLEQLIESCKDAFGATGASGSVCRYDFECQVGLHCANVNACPGQCAKKGAVSASCAETSDCEVGLTCFEGSCVPYVGAGAACTRDGPDCVSGAFCFDKGSGGVCVKLASVFQAASGSPCWDNNLFCQDGLSCLFEGAPFLSKAACTPKTTQANDACNWGFPDRCGDGVYCDVSAAQCVPLPVENAACAPAGPFTMQGNGLAPRCAKGLTCVNEVCRPLARLGEPCEGAEQCYSGGCGTPTTGGGKVCVTAACF